MTPIRIRGVTYRSIRAACRALAVSDKSINMHLDAGAIDLVGVLPSRILRPCLVDGVTYPSLSAAARALGVSPQAIHQRVNNGRSAYIGD